MLNQHPITPPPELVDKLFMLDTSEEGRLIAAYRAGADQELEACVEWLDRNSPVIGGFHLRIDRRPKPPSLKEQALKALQFVDEKLDLPLHNHCNAIHTIRRALEALDD
jgi:hypothetical protein